MLVYYSVELGLMADLILLSVKKKLMTTSSPTYVVDERLLFVVNPLALRGILFWSKVATHLFPTLSANASIVPSTGFGYNST